MRHRRHRGAREGQPDARASQRGAAPDPATPGRVLSPPAAGELAARLAWLDRHVNYEAAAGPPRAGSVGGLSLERMQRLVEVLDDPQRAYPVIHVTGTNGKGSVARMASAVLAEAGLSVGTYTSPHLQRLNERISRNGEPIDDADLTAMLEDLERLEPVVGVTPSWFELVTAAAFRWFADVAVDVAVIEVGMLGRFDATNVADGVVAVVTNIGHDHSDFAPGWRVAIAEEKAGIVKPGSTLVLGATDAEVAPVFYRAAAEAGAEAVLEKERDFEVEQNEIAVGGRLLDVRLPSGLLQELFLPLHGAHQGDNAALAIAAADAFVGGQLTPEVVQEGLGRVRIPGRFEVVGHAPLVVLDGAHNIEGAAAAATTLREDFTVPGETILVVGMLAPRDPDLLLEALDVTDATLVVACTAPSPRAIPAADVAAAAERLGGRTIVEPDVERAVERARRLATEDDAVLICGSLYVVGAARAALAER